MGAGPSTSWADVIFNYFTKRLMFLIELKAISLAEVAGSRTVPQKSISEYFHSGYCQACFE